MLESTVENYLVRRVKDIGGEIRKVQFIGRRGAPDRLAMFPFGPCVWIELKRPGAVAEPHQVREHDRMRAMGQTVIVIDTKAGVDTFIKWVLIRCSFVHLKQ